MKVQDAVDNIECQLMPGCRAKAPGLTDGALDRDDQFALPFPVIETEYIGRAGGGVILRVEFRNGGVVHQHDAELAVGIMDEVERAPGDLQPANGC